MDLLQMSVSGAVLILAVALVRLAALRAVPKRTFVVLWAVVLVRLLVPFAPLFTVSVPAPEAPPAQSAARPGQAERPAAVGRPAAPAAPAAPVGNAGPVAPVGTDGAPEDATAAAENAAPARAFPIRRFVRLNGTAGVCLFFACLYALGYRRFRRAVPVENAAVDAWLRAHPLRRPLAVRELDGLDSPLTYGALRPVILVPAGTDWSGDAVRYALEHEYVHARRFDAAFKLLLALALAVHWFNPAVWLMYALANRDVELSCDEAVLRRFGENERAPYARALLALEERRSALPGLYAPFGANTTKERIVAIMKFKKQSVLSLVLAAALVLSLAACAAASADREPPPAAGDGIVVGGNDDGDPGTIGGGDSTPLTGVEPDAALPVSEEELLRAALAGLATESGPVDFSGRIALSLDADGRTYAEYDTDTDNGRGYAYGIVNRFIYVHEPDASDPGGGSVRLTMENGGTLEFFADDPTLVCLSAEYFFRALSPIDNIFSPDPYAYARDWFDEAEWRALKDGFTVAYTGDDHMEAAAAFAQGYEDLHRAVSVGSGYRYVYQQTTVEDQPDYTESFRRRGEFGDDTWVFNTATVFVPADERAKQWSIAGNTAELADYPDLAARYPDAPEGAMIYWRVGYVTRGADGTWTGEITGTGW